MAEDKPSKPRGPTIFQRILGIDPEETKRRVEELKKGNAELEAFRTEVLPKMVKEQIERTKADGAACLAVNRAEAERVTEQATHQPKNLAVATDFDALSKVSRGNPAAIMDQVTIYQWNDGYDNLIYLRPSVGMDQVQAISVRIIEQQKAFGALGKDEQTTAKTNPNNPYKDFLESDARRIRFQELTQPPFAH